MINILATGLCQSEAGYRIFGLLGYVVEFIQIAVPILIIILGTIDLVKAIIAQNDEQMKKAQSTLIKRVIYGVVIFFIPMLINFIIGLVNTDTNADNYACIESFRDPKAAMKMADEVRDTVNEYVDIQNNVSKEDCDAQGGTFRELEGFGNQCAIDLNEQIKQK